MNQGFLTAQTYTFTCEQVTTVHRCGLEVQSGMLGFVQLSAHVTFARPMKLDISFIFLKILVCVI